MSFVLDLKGVKMELTISISLGFLFGIIACWVFWRYLRWQRPKVEIARKVSLTKDAVTGKQIIRFKILNKGRNQVIGITFKAWVCDLLEVPGGKMSRGLYILPISNSETATLTPRGQTSRPWGLTPEQLYRSEPEFDVMKLLSHSDHRILITLRVSDAVSGTTAVQQVTYCRGDVIEGLFEFGESLEIIPTSAARSGSI